ncbi:GNAT family N-acetyltransferase [Streptomyces sp. B-S-A8]|uniref:GNAT family N-acetyltransferase n=1 Tax=Streptomyces solicavernae TaxID=3043614 RepID=A0ABT6RQT5_9ACTN|nr:GNAT family N-acetyltransferase [Streptomyces sp. B-S-A8]MDI3386793.1 GNAT family N-acetyltransferase [Streptomyces sp. B-S-A8]
MTTTLRPTGPIQRDTDGVRSRTYQVCVNSRPVGTVELATHPVFGPTVGHVRHLAIDEPDRRRGRGTVAALAAEEVLRGWGCTRVEAAVPSAAPAALGLATALGYVERNRRMAKPLPASGPPALPPGTVARPMSDAEYVPWLADAKASYAQTWIERGVPEDQARAKSDHDHARLLPDGPATPGMLLRVLAHEGTDVGTLWLALQDDGAFVFDVEVDERHRGHGHGRSLMLLAEREAADGGAGTIGLNVFAGNTPALRLYESLGYQPLSYYLYKPLL